MTLPGAGETVGEAYIRILADGTGLGDSIERQFSRNNPKIRRAGSSGQAAYDEGWQEGERKRPIVREVLKDMRNSRGEFDKIGNELGGDWGKGIKRGLQREFGREVGNRLFRDFSEQLQRSGNMDFSRQWFKNMGPNLTRVMQQVEKDRLKIEADADKKIQTQYRETSRSLQAILSERYRILSKLDKEYAGKDRDRLRRSVENALADLRLGYHEAAQGIIKDSQRLVHRGDQGILRISRSAREGTREMGRYESKLREVMRFLESHDLGRYFGQGNRNNFINSFGNIIGIVVRGLGFATVGVAEFAARTKGAIKNFLKEEGTFAEKSKRIWKGLSDVIKKAALGIGAGLVASVVAGMGALGILQTILGPLVAGVSQLAGVIVALAGNIAFALVGAVTAAASAIGIGLVGALGAALPLLFTVITAVGLAAAAFGNMSTAQKKALKQRIKPLVDEWHSAQRAFRSGLFGNLDQQVGLFRKVLHQLNPLFHALGVSISGVATQLAKSFQLPGWQKNLKSMTDFMPKVITHLGDIFTKVFRGIGGVMRALAPISMRLLKVMTDGAKTFANWANSARGQHDLTKFFTAAWHTARLLGHALGGVASAIGKVLWAGRGIGDQLLKGIGGALDKFNAFLSSAKGSKALRSFLDEAWHSAEILWGALVNIGKVLADLLSAGRKLGDYLVKSLGDAFGKLDDFFKSAQGQQSLQQFFRITKTFVGYLMQALSGIGQLWLALDNTQTQAIINGVLSSIGQVLDWISKQIPFIQDVITRIEPYIARIVQAVENFVKAIEPIVGDIAHIVGNVLVGAFRILGPIIANVIQWLADVVKFLSDHKFVLVEFAGAVTALWIAWKGAAILDSVAVTIGTFIGRVQGMWANFTARLASMSVAARLAVLGLASALAGGAIGVAAGSMIHGTGGIIAGGVGGALAGGAIGSAGGPWGIAIGAISGGIAGLVTAWQSQGDAAVSATKRTVGALHAQKQAVDGLLSSLEAVNGAYNKQFMKGIVQQLDKMGVLKSASQLGLGPTVAPQAAIGDQKALRQVLALRDRLFSDRNKRIVANQLPGWQDLQKRQIAISNIVLALRRLDPNLVAAEKAWERQNAALGGSILKGKTVSDQMKNLTKEVKAHGAALRTDNANLVYATGLGVRHERQIEHIIASIRRNVVAQRLNGKTTEEASKSYYDQIDALKKQLIQIGFAKAGVERLFRTYQNFPRSVATRLLAIDSASHMVHHVESLVGKLAKPREVHLIAKLSKMNQVERLNYLLNHMKKFTDIYLRIHDPYLTAVHNRHGGTAFFASGGIVSGVTRALVGEAGPEAVVPLRRPLSQVDPSVRALSAIAQGMAPHLARGGIVGGGGPQKQVNIHPGALTVVTPTQDPVAVASEFLGQLVAKGYV